ncbi:ankyrin-2-like [Mytilus trossulus]|uniref:ankyrin-2-like n=1 Tax=Mytilus trossulus TaxID=6551 RepID=UPI00300737FC
MATISEEEENYVRMSLLVSEISPRAVRVLFDNEFNPLNINITIKKETNKLNDLKKKKIINQSQWEILFPRNGVPESKMFDITLMITLLTNLTGLNHYGKLPLVTDITVSADLGRVKYYRNLIAHNKDGKLENTFFIKAWNDISGAVCRLGGQSMLDECNELRTKILGQSTVPWNIREQISTKLEAWTLDDSNLVETKAANYVLKCIQEHSCVTITASPGVGKTVTLRHVALQMGADGYNVLPVTNPHDIVKFNNPNKKTLFVMDDFCGTNSLNQSDVNSFESVMESIKELLIQNVTTKIIVACRLQVYQDDRFKFLSIFRGCECNLLSEDLCLSQTEEQSIAELYLKEKTSEIISICDLYDCFPRLCKWYNENPQPNIIDFFKNPFQVYELEFDKLHQNRHFEKYCALAMCVMFNNRLKEELLTDKIDKETKRRIKNTCEACKLNRGTSRLTLLDEMKSLIHTFMKKEQDVYTSLHDKIFDFLAYYFGKSMPQCLINNADSWLISQRFVLEKRDSTVQFITIKPEYHLIYMQRLICDWSKGKVQHVFDNLNLQIPEIRQKFLCHLNTLDISFQRQLALTCDVAYKNTVLIHCCFLGDIPFINWCINHGIDVNKCNLRGESPLLVTAQEGHTEVMELLLDNKADIHKCEQNEISPLFIACFKNRTEIVKLLLDHNANIDKCRHNGESPLVGACLNDNIEVVKLLLDKKTDINKLTEEGASPLLIACQSNYIEIVKLLLENKANITTCAYNGASPLYVACQNNYEELAKLLLENKAEINSCLNSGESPLWIACQNNHIAIVNILLNKEADINKCVHDGASPLYVACQNNNVDIVKILLHNKADVNKCSDSGASPLFIASHSNRTDIVKLLLDSKTDINKCLDVGASPLFIACMNNHIEIVKILLYNNADIHKCEDSGRSPLFIACENNHKEIVKLLLDNKADVNKCNDNIPSPLFMACQNDIIEIVKVLLDNKADVNKCNNKGTSPLCIACYNNNIKIVKVLLDNRADINKCLNNGATPLFIACQKNHKEIVKELLDNRADIDKCTFSGSSPLFVSYMSHHKDIVEMLVQNGADCNKLFGMMFQLVASYY